jgi:CheY-like chemotaxis protein
MANVRRMAHGRDAVTPMARLRKHSDPPPAGERILLVEDNPNTLAGLAAFLTGAGFAVNTAIHGSEAVDLLSRDTLPQLIILDLMMPKVTGWDLLKHLQGDLDLRQIPVIVTTALHPAEARTAGADVVLQKPIQPGELLVEVRRLLALKA